MRFNNAGAESIDDLGVADSPTSHMQLLKCSSVGVLDELTCLEMLKMDI